MAKGLPVVGGKDPKVVKRQVSILSISLFVYINLFELLHFFVLYVAKGYPID